MLKTELIMFCGGDKECYECKKHHLIAEGLSYGL